MVEGETESKEMEMAGRLFEAAEVIYFLGFGYHETNLNRLLYAMGGSARSFRNRGPSTDRRKVMGTALGMKAAETLSARNAHIDCLDLDCLEFLRSGGELV